MSSISCLEDCNGFFSENASCLVGFFDMHALLIWGLSTDSWWCFVWRTMTAVAKLLRTFWLCNWIHSSPYQWKVSYATGCSSSSKKGLIHPLSWAAAESFVKELLSKDLFQSSLISIMFYACLCSYVKLLCRNCSLVVFVFVFFPKCSLCRTLNWGK